MALRRPGSDPLLGRVFKDTYRIQELVGPGALGRVYRGEHLRLKKPILIKVLGDELRGSEEFVARFRKEAILQAMVNHPRAVQTIDLDEADDGTLYIVSEDAPGEPLDRVLASEGRLPTERATDIVSQVLEILSVAHGARIVHRDLRPANILVERRGDRDVVRVLDFGIAVLLESGGGGIRGRRGTAPPYYLSPEQAAGEEIDGRSDLYSLGVVFYEMLTGDLPIEDANVDRFFVKLLNDYPPKISEDYPDVEVPKETEEIILNCLSKDPFNRFENAGEMLAVLSGGETKKTRHFLLIAAASVVIAGVVILAIFLTGGGYSPVEEEAAARARDAASRSHPSYAAALALFGEAEELREGGDYAAAYARFKEARQAFDACREYDSTAENDAQAALQAARASRAGHPLTEYGRSEIEEARNLVEAGNYDEAYRRFDAAANILAYDDASELAARKAMEDAAEDHPSYKTGERYFEDALATFEKRPLTGTDVELAQRKFADAMAEFSKAVAYDETLENEANAARGSADPMNPRYEELIKKLGDAVFAKRQAEYERAYALFTEARDGFRSIAGSYDEAKQRDAEAARTRADRSHPLFRTAEDVYDEAVSLRSSGDYEESYRKFDEARTLFQKSVTYDTIHMDTARQARVAADRDHPSYEQGEGAYERGKERKDAGDYEAADRLFQEALTYFRQARPYSSIHERAASRAKRRAFEGMPISYAAAEAAFQKGMQAKERFDYEAAYRYFEQAEQNYELARFDEFVRDEVADLKRQAQTGSSAYQAGMRAEADAIEAFNDGDGPAAEELYDRAKQLFREARQTSGPSNPTIDTSGGDAERKARTAARQSRRVAEEWRDRTSEWNDAGEINRQTQGNYDQGMQKFSAAMQAWNGKNYPSAGQLFDEAAELFKKVSKFKR